MCIVNADKILKFVQVMCTEVTIQLAGRHIAKSPPRRRIGSFFSYNGFKDIVSTGYLCICSFAGIILPLDVGAVPMNFSGPFPVNGPCPGRPCPLDILDVVQRSVLDDNGLGKAGCEKGYREGDFLHGTVGQGLRNHCDMPVGGNGYCNLFPLCPAGSVGSPLRSRRLGGEYDITLPVRSGRSFGYCARNVPYPMGIVFKLNFQLCTVIFNIQKTLVGRGNRSEIVQRDALRIIPLERELLR